MKNLRYTQLKKSNYINSYIASEPMQYDFHLLYLLLTIENIDINHWSNFCKTSSISCWSTSQIFINKNNGSIEIFDIYDLANKEELCLPKSPKITISAANFLQFMTSWSQLQKENPQDIIIAIDDIGYAYLTTDVRSIEKTSFLVSIKKSISGLFTSK